MAVDPSVWLVLEGGGSVIAKIPPFTSVPAPDQILSIKINGGSRVNYKIEAVRYELDLLTYPVAEEWKAVQGHCEIIVSVVP